MEPLTELTTALLNKEVIGSSFWAGSGLRAVELDVGPDGKEVSVSASGDDGSVMVLSEDTKVVCEISTAPLPPGARRSIIASSFTTLSLRLNLLSMAAVCNCSRLCSVQRAPLLLQATQVTVLLGSKIQRNFRLRPDFQSTKAPCS